MQSPVLVGSVHPHILDAFRLRFSPAAYISYMQNLRLPAVPHHPGFYSDPSKESRKAMLNGQTN